MPPVAAALRWIVALGSVACTVSIGNAQTQPAHLQWARKLVAEVAPAQNRYGSSPTFVVWDEDGSGPARNRSVCSSFVSHDLERAYGFGTSEIERIFGTRNPHAKDYYDAIASGRGFAAVGSVLDARPGDIIALRYPVGSRPTGHVMIVDATPVARIETKPLVADTRQFDVRVIDSSHSFHGFDDTRYLASGRLGQGIGGGVLRIYLTGAGDIAGYAWSTRKVSKFVPQSEHQMVIGRFSPARAADLAPSPSAIGAAVDSDDADGGDDRAVRGE